MRAGIIRFTMTRTITGLVTASLLGLLLLDSSAQDRTLVVAVNPAAPELRCPSAPRTAQPAPRPATPVAEDPEVVPTLDDLGDLADRPPVPAPTIDPELAAGFSLASDSSGVRPLRLGVWGDSHMASGVFAGELARVLGTRGADVDTAYLPPTMSRSGVRLPIRKYCQSTTWRLEPAYTAGRTVQTGPALANLRTTGGSAYLWIDFRLEGRPSRVNRLKVLYQPTGTASSVGIRIDDGPEQKVALTRTTASSNSLRTGEIEIASKTGAPLSTIKLRLLQGAVVLQGFMLAHRDARPVTMDVFGLPSATVRGWAQVDTEYMKDALRGTSYDAVILEYGTNEGNDSKFERSRYAAGLDTALTGLRSVFPDAACLLIGPTDRGIRIRKPSASRSRRITKPAPPPDLLRYARIHQEITSAQAEVGRRHGCASWDWQAHMGGPGGSYLWALSSPPLAARDLIHLTPAGYRQSALALAKAIGWE